MFTPEKRNMDNVQFADLRKAVDDRFNRAHDELSIAYYDHWKKGLSSPWHGYDVQATPEESKALFDQLHGLIFHLHEVALEDEHIKQGRRDAKFEAHSLKEKNGKRSVQRSLEMIIDMQANGIELDL